MSTLLNDGHSGKRHRRRKSSSSTRSSTHSSSRSSTRRKGSGAGWDGSGKFVSVESGLFEAKDISRAARMWRGGLKNLFQWIFDFFHSTSVLSLPLFVFLCVASLDFLIVLNFTDAKESLIFSSKPVVLEDPRRESAEQAKKYVMILVYMMTVFLSILNFKELYHYFRSNLHVVLMPLILIPGVLYSVNPTKVLTNTIIVIVSLLIAALFFCVHTRRDRLKNFYLTVFLSMFFVHLASVLLMPYLDINVAEFFAEDKRYAGFAGNPNTLGSTAVLGIWGAVCLIHGRVATKKVRVFAFFGMLMFILNVKLSGSGTSMVATLLIFALMIWMRLLALVTHRTRVLTSIGLVCLVVLLFLAILTQFSLSELLVIFADSLGKDATLTGRTELWQIAASAISERPVFGWSFDSHESVKANPNYNIEYNHYHNGFLDVIVLGGFVLFTYLMYNFAKFVYAFQRAFKTKPSFFPLVIPLVILIIQNMGEYSLLRPLSAIWQVYLTTYVLLTYVEYKPKQKIKMTWRSEYADLVKTMARQSKRRRSS